MLSTVGEQLRTAAGRLAASGSDTPRLDAEVLLGHVLGVDRATLLASPEVPVGDKPGAAFEELVERRARGEPVSYLRGIKEFYGLAFTVDPRALIPRPETETLIDLALVRLTNLLTATPRPPGSAPVRIVDVGTGSGAIAVTIAVEARRRGFGRELAIVATDVSNDAVSLAVENAVGHGVADAIEFVEADLAAELTDTDLLLANLPYIPSAVLPTLPVAASFEPASALDGGPDGLALIGRLVAQLPRALNANGVALLEIGSDQEAGIREVLLATLGDGWTVEVHPDLAGRPRVAEIRRVTQ